MWDSRADDPDVVMVWAACCVGLFGLLRAGEMTAPINKDYDPQLRVDNPRDPQMVRIWIKQSKTDPFRKGIGIYLGKTSSDLCPVTALLKFLIVRKKGEGPLFRYQDGRLLTRPRLVEAVRAALREAGLDDAKYCNHSFRIGAATTTAAKGIKDAMIKTLGRWRSLAYLPDS